MNNIKISKPINITKEIFEKFKDGDNDSESIAVCRCPSVFDYHDIPYYPD